MLNNPNSFLFSFSLLSFAPTVWRSKRNIALTRLSGHLHFVSRIFVILHLQVGQFVASSPTLFPPEYVREFQKCLDKTDPVPWSECDKSD